MTYTKFKNGLPGTKLLWCIFVVLTLTIVTFIFVNGAFNGRRLSDPRGIPLVQTVSFLKNNRGLMLIGSVIPVIISTLSE